MNLTFKGFLRDYCHELTGLRTDSLKKLVAAAATDAPAAAEAVMLFAAIQGKATYLAHLSENAWVTQDYSEQARILDATTDLEAYLASGGTPLRYGKAWNAYLAKRDAIHADRRIIALMRQKTNAALQATGMTVYRLCKDLDLDLGSAYAYLHAGDTSKVSKDTARRIMDHARDSLQDRGPFVRRTFGPLLFRA